MPFPEVAIRVVAPKARTPELGELVPTLSKFSALARAAGLEGGQFCPHMMRSVNFSPPEDNPHVCSGGHCERHTQPTSLRTLLFVLLGRE